MPGKTPSVFFQRLEKQHWNFPMIGNAAFLRYIKRTAPGSQLDKAQTVNTRIYFRES
jgi:hypothetical protein